MSTAFGYQPSPITRHRRGKAEMAAIRDDLVPDHGIPDDDLVDQRRGTPHDVVVAERNRVSSCCEGVHTFIPCCLNFSMSLVTRSDRFSNT